MRVSIVIPAHNEERHLRACLEAITAQTVQPFEVIVVDNNSTDATPTVAADFPFVRIVHESRQGIVFARDAGFDAVRGDIIGRIDADITMPRHWVEHITRFYADAAHGRSAWSGAGYFYNIRLPRFVSWAYGMLAFRFNRLIAGHVTLWGSNMAITRAQWQAVRNDVCRRTDIHEDLDLAIHLHQAGYDITHDTSIKTNARMRRVQSDHGALWGYLQWWPRTLRIHGNPLWGICWLLGAAMLYILSFFWLFLDKVSTWCGKQLRPIPPDSSV